MGLHWDYRLVVGDKAYSWATKKELPGPGHSIVLFEQPVHDADYALSSKVVIPDGNYGAGVTTLDWARKAHIEEDSTPSKLVIKVTTPGQEGRFLLKKIDGSIWGDKAWLFRNLENEHTMNKYLEKVAKIVINPSHKGLLHKDMGLAPGKKISTGALEAEKNRAKASGNSAEVKRVTFAENARKWKN